MIGWRGPRGAKGREAWSGGGPRDGDGATGTTTRLLRCAEVTRQLATCMVDSTSAWPSIIPHPRPHLGCSGCHARALAFFAPSTRQHGGRILYYTYGIKLATNRMESVSTIFSNRMESMAGFHPATRSGKSSALRSVDSRCELCSQAFVFDTPFADQKTNRYEFRTRII